MVSDVRWRYAGVVLFVVLCMLVTGMVVYDDYSSKIGVLDMHVQDLVVQLVAQEKQLMLLDEQMLANFEKLEQSVNQKTSAVKLDLESQLSSVESKIADLNVRSSDFSVIAADVIKSVVSVRTDKGSGSGVIVTVDGVVLTNKHVVDGASRIVVTDHNKDVYRAVVVGVSRNSDLAVLRIDSDRLFRKLDFARSSDVQVGSRVIAVGNPLGLSFTVTEGIVSAVGRVIDASGVGYVQTDVPINPGNSGGPLVNSNKKVVGITTLKISNSEGLGFAVPSDVAEDVVEQVLRS
jgi:S1-C subfamily serine protease